MRFLIFFNSLEFVPPFLGITAANFSIFSLSWFSSASLSFLWAL